MYNTIASIQLGMFGHLQESEHVRQIPGSWRALWFTQDNPLGEFKKNKVNPYLGEKWLN